MSNSYTFNNSLKLIKLNIIIFFLLNVSPKQLLQSSQEKETNQQFQQNKQTRIQQEPPNPSDNLTKQYKYQQKHKPIAKQSLKLFKKKKEGFEKQRQMTQRVQEKLEKQNQQSKYRSLMSLISLISIGIIITIRNFIMYESTKMCTGMNGVDFQFLALTDLKLDQIKEAIKQSIK